VPKRIIRPEEFGDKRSRHKTIPTDMPTSYGLVVVKEGKILLVKPRGANFWEIPKGGAKVVEELPDGRVKREAAKVAAARETKEETGITATITKPLDFVKDEDWNDGEGKAVVAFLAGYKSGMVDRKSGQAMRIQKSEIEQAKFFEPEEALDIVADYLKPIIKQAIGHMKESSDTIDQMIDTVLEAKPGKDIKNLRRETIECC